jgi:hypothetical protein
MAQKKIHEFREAVYLLCGYKIEVVNSQYRLHPIYAEKDTDNLLFQRSGTELDLLETEYASKLSKDSHLYLSKHHSIPGFLSQIIIDLLNKKAQHV